MSFTVGVLILSGRNSYMALVLHLDENNSNSWSGEPTVNYFDNSTGTLQTTGNYSVTAVTTTPTGNN
jgi:hypothetical protein